MHLPGIGVSELPQFQIDDHQTTQSPVKEQEVDAIPFVVDAQSSLSSDKREIAS
jgi:hypothetical protein